MTNDQGVELEEEKSDEELEPPESVMEPFDLSKIDIVVEPKSLDALIKRISHKEIDMNTDFQRHPDLWTYSKMSRLIESILLRFPLPAFYFDASDESNWLIVDGLQRLSSISRFVIDKKLRLSGLEFLTDLHGKGYDQLGRVYQRRINECPITVYMIKPGTPSNVKYSIFRRLNTGGLTLNNQEVRNALAEPVDRKLLEELAQSEHSKVMLGDLSKRMKDQELVLRFWAFYRFDYLEPKNKKEIASFLDKAMEEIKKGDDEYRSRFKSKFDIAIGRCRQLLGRSGFERNPSSGGRKRSINSTLFEVWMVELAKLTESDFESLMKKREIFEGKTRTLLKDVQFERAITYSTQKKEHVEIRYEKVGNLVAEVLND